MSVLAGENPGQTPNVVALYAPGPDSFSAMVAQIFFNGQVLLIRSDGLTDRRIVRYMWQMALPEQNDHTPEHLRHQCSIRPPASVQAIALLMQQPGFCRETQLRPSPSILERPDHQVPMVFEPPVEISLLAVPAIRKTLQARSPLEGNRNTA